MKRLRKTSIALLAAAFLVTTTLFAQEATTVTVQVKREGKVVKDTTYRFDDPEEASHALKMMEVLSGDGEQMIEYH
jgi:hypothetical protein